MFLAYPLALILDFLPGKTLKHTFSLVVGLWFAQQIFQSQWVHSFITSLVTYLICLIFPRKLAPGLVRFHNAMSLNHP